jgi:hypothetical protein
MHEHARVALARLIHSRSLLFARTQAEWPLGIKLTDEDIFAGLEAFPVEVRVAPEFASTVAGQEAVLLAVNLLARMFSDIRLVIPREECFTRRLPATGGARDLPSVALMLARAVNPTADVGLSCAPDPRRSSIALGPFETNAAVEGPFTVAATGNGWFARAGSVPTAGPVPISSNPLGPMLGACFASMELWKAFLRSRLHAWGVEETPWSLAASGETTWSLLRHDRESRAADHDELPSMIEVGELDVVSAGAMSHAALNGLAAVPGVRGRGGITESKHLDEPDLNRYVLAIAADLGAAKAPVLATRARNALDLVAEVSAYQGSERRAARMTMGTPAPLALVGVDHLPSRIDVQRDWPELIVNGATEGPMACVSVHPADAGTGACLACITDPGAVQRGTVPTLAPVSCAAGLAMAAEVVKARVDRLREWRLEGRLWINVMRPDLPYSIRTDRPKPTPGCSCLRAESGPAAA